MHYLYTLLFALIISIPANAQNALNFDGNNDVVQSNYAGPLGTTNRTFEAWVYVSSSAPTSNLCILDYGANIAGSRNTFNVSGNRALSYISGGTNANISSSPNDVPVDQWVHVAFVLNSGTGFFYVDGVQVGTGNLSNVNTPAGNQNVKVGERVSGGSIPFHGSIDEVKVWDVARTQTEIQTSFNDEMCTAHPNLKLYYRFNEGTANGTNAGVLQASDDSGNGYTGTLSGFALTGTTSNWTNGVALTPGLTSTTIQEDACETYTWSANGQTYTTSGIYSTVLTGSTGCDSIVNLDLSVFSPNDLTTNQIVCDSFFWGVNNTTYYTTTSVVENVTTSQGCPYQHALNVTVNQSSFATQTESACDSYTWAVDGSTYTASGIYTVNYQAQNGCDSIIELDLTINQSPVATISSNPDGSLSTSTFSGTISWYDCDNDQIIVGETNTIFIPTANGNYAVILSDLGSSCADTSDCILVDYVSTDELTLDSGIDIQPNPTSGDFTIALDAAYGEVTVEVLDATGKTVQSNKVSGDVTVEMTLAGEPGVYFLVVKTKYGSLQDRIVKL